MDLANLLKLLPARKKDANKSDFGHVLIIGGDYGMGGAVRLAGEAAARTGAGLVSIATRAEHAGPIIAARPELMVHGVAGTADIIKLYERATVIVLGPGLGQSKWSHELFHSALAASQPKVVDADALNLLAALPPQQQENWILTPHPGEAARLLQTKTAEIQADRVLAAKILQEQYHGTIVLKGAGTLIQSANSPPYVCPAGNPGMASGGMGDLLSGVIAGLLAQGLTLAQAAQLGVCLHATAGDFAAKNNGERGLLALDLLPYLRKLINDLSC